MIENLLGTFQKLTLRVKAAIFLSIALVACLFLHWRELSSLFAMLAIIQIFHTIFYTEQPRIFWFYLIVGGVISLWAVGFTSVGFDIGYIYVAIFSSLTFFECFRVVFMAILKYPSSIQNLKTLNEDLENRVSQRTYELQKANEKLLELDKMKTAFLQQASHDLRTPLAAIKGSLDNLTLGVAGELTAKQGRIVGRATRSVDRLTNLINDILDLSRIETGRTKLEKNNVSFKTIVESSMQEHKPSAEARQIQMEPLICDEPLFIHADASKIERIVGELINNAIKYTPANGTVTVCLEEKDRYACLRVIDSGIGMAPEECQKIWERFYRTTDSQFLAKGSGLGLSIAKELVELHEGTVEVNSTKGAGSTFTVLLPIIKESIPHAKCNDHHS